ncbi:helix-turn-helix domain-containing protein [Arthrobacter sp. ISL-85]|nr:helix-turn-helix domain-containing protein [Arthrobacter sp. ISL-85]
MTGTEKRRFLTIEQVAEELNVGLPLVRSLVKCGELRGIQIGRGLWRISVGDLKDYAERTYAETAGPVTRGELALEHDDSAGGD